MRPSRRYNLELLPGKRERITAISSPSRTARRSLSALQAYAANVLRATLFGSVQSHMDYRPGEPVVRLLTSQALWAIELIHSTRVCEAACIPLLLVRNKAQFDRSTMHFLKGKPLSRPLNAAGRALKRFPRGGCLRWRGVALAISISAARRRAIS